MQAVILAIDVDASGFRSASSSCSRMPGKLISRRINVNDMVHGRVCRLAGFGAFVELAEGVEGLCHFSEVPGLRARRSEQPPLTLGEEYDFKIIKMSEAEKKIGLSLKAVGDDEERHRLDDYQRQAAAATIDHRRSS